MNQSTPNTIAESQQYCQQVVDRSGSSFRRSFDFLRAESQNAMNAFYAYARLVDNVADDSKLDRHLAIEMIQDLHAWLTNTIYSSSTSSDDTPPQKGLSVRSLQSIGFEFHRIAPALQYTVERFGIEPELLHVLLDGAAMDLQPDFVIHTFEQYDQYCYCVASSVGLACMRIWHGDLDECREDVIRCGLAFQTTNIIRDVAEDARCGRLYIPNDLLTQYGCDRQSWLACNAQGDWLGLLQHMIDRATEQFLAARKIADCLPIDSRRMFSLMWHTYYELLQHLSRNLDRVWRERISLPSHRKAGLYLKHAVTPIYQRKYGRPV